MKRSRWEAEKERSIGLTYYIHFSSRKEFSYTCFSLRPCFSLQYLGPAPSYILYSNTSFYLKTLHESYVELLFTLCCFPLLKQVLPPVRLQLIATLCNTPSFRLLILIWRGQMPTRACATRLRTECILTCWYMLTTTLAHTPTLSILRRDWHTFVAILTVIHLWVSNYSVTLPICSKWELSGPDLLCLDQEYQIVQLAMDYGVQYCKSAIYFFIHFLYSLAHIEPHFDLQKFFNTPLVYVAFHAAGGSLALDCHTHPF